jgi:serine/threonine protein kinase
MRLREGQIIAEKYKIDGFLGRGGMGEVVSAKQLTLNRRVAIKVLTGAGTGDERVARFVREAQATARIESEHAARVIDFGDLEDGTPYFVMEYLEGKDLQEMLSTTGRFSMQMAADVAIQTCEALATAHAQQIVHRDIKPANLFVTHRPDGSLLLKVLDFGISKVITDPGNAALTQASAQFGTPPYMSPEQIRSSGLVDHRTDIWSLGVVLYELLAGERPFDASTRGEVFAHIERGSPRSILELRPDVPAAVAALIEGCLERECAARISDVGEIAEILEPFASEDIRPLVRRIERILAGRPLSRANARTSPEPEADLTVERVNTEETRPPEPTPPAAPLATTELASGNAAVWLGRSLPSGLRIERCIGRGAMGEVHEAVRDSGERVAIKLILAEIASDPVARERFVREAKAASSLSSRHVVRIVDPGLGEMDGHPFIVMELLQGETLEDLIRSRGALSPRAVALAFTQVCEALAEAHGRALIHRDIKPSNLFLHEAPGGEIVLKICDFGIAKLGEAPTAAAGENGLTQAWQVLGSPAYMSPEQMSDAREVDARSDVWSVCVSLYEALAGARPWPRTMSAHDIGVVTATRGVPPLSEAAPWLDPALVGVVHRGLAYAKEARWASVEELAGALRPFTGGMMRLDREALAALPESSMSRSRARRSGPRSWATIGVLLATLVGGAVVAKGFAGRRPDIGGAAGPTTVVESVVQPMPSGAVSGAAVEPATPSALVAPSASASKPVATAGGSHGAVAKGEHSGATPAVSAAPTPSAPAVPSARPGMKMEEGF